MEFYRNVVGALAVSLDGERVIIPTGRVIDLTEAWVEVTDGSIEKLTPAAQERLAALLDQEEMRLAKTAAERSAAEKRREYLETLEAQEALREEESFRKELARLSRELTRIITGR